MSKREFPKSTKYEGIRVTSASSIEIGFYYNKVRCQERVKINPTPENLRRAHQHRQAILYAIEKGTFNYRQVFPESKKALMFCDEGEKVTVQHWLENVYLPRVLKHLKASTLRDYKKSIKYELVPAFGKMLLSDLKLSHVKRWADKKKCGVKRIKNILIPLRKALDEAVEDEYIKLNVIKGWYPKKRDVAPREDKIDPFTREEQKLILMHSDGQVKNLIQFWLWTGLRTSEINALEWSDVDFKKGTVSVVKSLTDAADKFEDTKTAKGRRVVTLLPPAIQALKSQKLVTGKRKKEVFQNPRTEDRWKGDRDFRRGYWYPVLKKAGVRKRYPYQMRHTFASMMLSSGENPSWISKQMGHSDLNMIFKNYGRWIADKDGQAGMKAVKKFHSPSI